MKNVVKEKKVSVSFRTSKKIIQMMLERIVAEEYGLKGKSKWVSEAVERFLAMPDYVACVDIASAQEDMSEPVLCNIPEDLSKKIDTALIEVRRKYPDMEGVKSNILRASINQRLIQVK